MNWSVLTEFTVDKARRLDISYGQAVTLKVAVAVTVLTSPVWIPAWYVGHLLRGAFRSRINKITGEDHA